MITVFSGTNDFEIERALKNLKASFDGEAERFDGAELTSETLADATSGATLFASKRLVILKNLSDNKSLWSETIQFLERVGDDTQLILVEPSLDKRSKTYKWLQKNATIKDFPAWSDRDASKAQQWLQSEASSQNIAMTTKDVRMIIERVGIDQWRLAAALEKLTIIGEVTPETIEKYVDIHPDQNVFVLLETALRNDSARLRERIVVLELSDDPYRVFGLLSSQVLQLAALVFSDKDSSAVAKDIGAHPFVLSKLAGFATRLSASKARRIIAITAETDADMKLSVAAPWVLIERMLQKIAAL